MYRSRAKPGWHIIDDKMIKTDSQMEAKIIEELVCDGFSGKWRRLRRGIAFGVSRYTPDVELSILHEELSHRAIVEFKAFSAMEFTLRDRRRMLAAAHFYRDAIPMLYIRKTDQWYFIGKHCEAVKANRPTPGVLLIHQLSKPRFTVPIFNRYGRSYFVTPVNLALKVTADSLSFGLNAVIGPKKRRSRHRK